MEPRFIDGDAARQTKPVRDRGALNFVGADADQLLPCRGDLDPAHRDGRRCLSGLRIGAGRRQPHPANRAVTLTIRCVLRVHGAFPALGLPGGNGGACRAQLARGPAGHPSGCECGRHQANHQCDASGRRHVLWPYLILTRAGLASLGSTGRRVPTSPRPADALRDRKRRPKARRDSPWACVYGA